MLEPALAFLRGLATLHKDNTPPMLSKLGHIIDLHLGDGRVTRVVQLRLFERASATLSVFPVDIDETY